MQLWVGDTSRWRVGRRSKSGEKKRVEMEVEMEVEMKMVMEVEIKVELVVEMKVELVVEMKVELVVEMKVELVVPFEVADQGIGSSVRDVLRRQRQWRRGAATVDGSVRGNQGWSKSRQVATSASICG
jgi:hypothetical protein